MTQLYCTNKVSGFKDIYFFSRHSWRKHDVQTHVPFIHRQWSAVVRQSAKEAADVKSLLAERIQNNLTAGDRERFREALETEINRD